MTRVTVLVTEDDDGFVAEAIGLDVDDGEGATESEALSDLKDNLRAFLEESGGKLVDVIV